MERNKNRCNMEASYFVDNGDLEAVPGQFYCRQDNERYYNHHIVIQW